MDIEKNPDEVIEKDNDGEKTLEEVNAELAKLTETNENLNKALKEERSKSKEAKKESKEDNTPDVNSIVKRTLKIEKLESKYDGENGKPKFDEKELKEYAEENSLPYDQIDPELVYEMKHRATLSDIGKKETLKKNKGVITADGKPVSMETAKGKIAKANTPAEIMEMMSGIGQ